MTIAALFVEAKGCYANLPDVDVWPLERDARLYDGPYPCVVHPPCNRWINFAKLNHARWGGDHNRPGNDGGCFASALASVRKWGGVLEHPAFSHAWSEHHLFPPPPTGWGHCARNDWVCEVWQSAYGHKARKRTWLFYVGDVAPFELNWNKPGGEAQIGYGWDQRKPALSGKAASATPEAFRDMLIDLARNARKEK